MQLTNPEPSADPALPAAEPGAKPEAVREPEKKRRRTATGDAPKLQHYKVNDVLTDADRAEYEKLVSHPNTRVVQLQDYLKSRGHRVSRGSIGLHRKSLHQELKRMREIAEMARSFCELTRELGPSAVAEASHAKFEMMLMSSLYDLPEAKQMPLADWQSMAKTINGVVGTRKSVEDLRAAFEAKAKAAAEEAKETASKRGATPAEVADRVREILGV